MASSIPNSHSAEFVESDVIELVPSAEYDAHRAKLRASLSWLLSKVYGSEVPQELSDPFYENTHGQLVLRPVMVNILASSELYCQACGNMFPETHTQWKGHWSIIQVLSRKGIYIADVQDTAVTETVLVQTAPFRLKAHLALIDALMKAYACEVASVEAVVKAVRKMTTFPASSELPSNPEESLKFWINKVCAKLSDNRGQQLSEGGATTHKDQDTSKTPQPSNLPVQLPAMEDVMRDVGDGCNVAAMIAYYKPQHLNLADVCLKESIGIADSLHNLRLIGQYCKSHLPWKCFHLSYEDLLYTHEIMKVNIIAFLTDFFYCFEGPGAAIMNGNVRQAALEAIEAMPAAGKRSGLSTIPSVPISSATKKSFQRLPFEDTSVNLGMGRSNLSSPSSHQPLLPRRGIGRYSNGQETDELGTSPPTRRGRRVQSLSCSQDRDLIQRSVIAWNDDQKIQNRSDSRRWPQDSSNSPMLSRVSIDSDMAHSLDASLSLDLAELETPRTQRGTAALDPRHPDYMEVESLASGQASHTPTSQRTPHASNERSSTQRTPSGQHEPLMPAVLKPTKERETSLTKAQERGDRTPRRKKTSSSEPQTPSPLATPQQPLPHQMSSAEHAMTSSADDLAFSLSTSSDETTVSSLPPGESQSPRYVHQGPAPMSAPSISSAPPTSVPPTSEQIGAFSPAPSSLTPPNSSRSEVAASIAGSYTVEDRASTAQAARAAGIPVVTDSGDLLNQSKSREGSVCSSGEYSDHESQKIHQDHKVRESGLVSSGNAAPPPGSTAYGKPTMVINDQLTSSGGDDAYLSRLTKSPSGMTTNFAELKRLKDELGRNMDKVDNSALIYMQSGSHGGPQNNVSPGGSKSAFLLKQGQGQQQGQGDAGKTPGPVYNDGSPVADKNCASEAAAAEDDFGGSSDLQQLRLKLEQKRKEIERKKHRQEAQQNKMRQRLGKAAFMRVVSKHLNGGENADDVGSFPNSAVRPEISANSTQAQLQARLGHPGHRLPLNSLPRGQGSSMARPAPQTLLAQVQNTSAAIHPDASANRFTDWRTQSQLSKGGVASAGGGVGGPGLVAHRPGHLGELQQQQQQQQQHVLLPGHGGGGSANQSDAGSDSSSSASSHKSGNKAFSRESIQQTIDNVKNHWFRNSNDLISGGGVCSEEEMDHTDGDSNASSLVHNKLSAASPKTVLEQQGLRAGSRQATPPHAQSLANVQEPFPPTSSPAVHQPTASRSREASSSPHHEGVDTETYQEYDSSLDKLNNSLTELQGEIMRLSLQHEQMKASQSPVGFTPDSFDPRLSDALAAIGSPAAATDTSKTSRPIHGIPPQAPYVHGAMARHHRSASPASTPQQQLQQQQPQPSLPSGQPAPTQQQLLPPSTKQKVHESDLRLDSQSGIPAVVEAQTCVQQEKMDVNPDGGFFISFGGDSTPKRDKPKLSDHRRGVSPCRQDVADDVDSSEVAKIVAGQTISVLTPQKQDGSSEEAAPLGVGFVIQDEAARTKEQIAEDEMQKKKIKLMDMQKKRKEDQERKRMEKEAEIARKQEEKMQKEEDVERKKAEERARRDVIFQQYLQRKQQDEDDSTPPPPSQVKHRVEKRSSGGSSRPRPKSMMAKTKPMTPEPGALGGQDSGSSSQEDLTGRGGPGSRASPSIMSTLRSSYHFRAPQTSRIRKAVSCNTLTHNGSAGPPATYRRPPSPDLCRIRQQRQRGNSQDSGSETGSGSNPGSDYAGPKLFVKPSAKSNRHIIANAISHCCLAGSVNTDMKNKVLEEMSKCEANHFLILFRDAGCQYRGLFIFSPETEEAFKAHGVGPKHITNQMCEKFYKYNSGAKSFTEITSTKHLSVSVDAVVLFSSLWKTGKAAVKR